MASVKKIIGRVPVSRGEYMQGRMYYRHNIVTWLGSSFECLVDGNTNTPATVVNDAFVLGDGWKFFTDASYSYLAEKRSIDISQDDFDRIPESELDPTKTYYIYE